MANHKNSLAEKIGYGFGDMASSMFWKIFSYYLPFFYSTVFHLTPAQTVPLFLITGLWDAISDPIMGILADRTDTKWGKYRPYLLWICLPFAIAGILLFTTPGGEDGVRIIWAYATYILMMTVYTAINVPYGAMLGVMTDDSATKTVFSSFRMFFAYGGSFIALLLWEPVRNFFSAKGYTIEQSWQGAMIVVAAICLVLFLLCFKMTKEHIKTKASASIGGDLLSLLKNAPWWILIGAALCSNLFNAVRGSSAAYFFKDIIGEGVSLNLGDWAFLFYAGIFLSIGEISNMLGVAIAAPISKKLGKKSTYIFSMLALIIFSILFFFVPINQTGFWMMIVLQITISIFTGIISPLIWSMYADAADFAEHRDGSASTALIFSSATMAQKLGSYFGASVVMAILGIFGYNTAAGAIQSPEALTGLKVLMSWVPAGVAALAILVCAFYPLTSKKMNKIQEELKERRTQA